MEETLTCSTAAERPLRILVADDNAIIRVAIRGLLRRIGHSVDVVSNGREALEAAANHPYDVVFLDVQMPVMGGFEAARSLRFGLREGDSTRIVGFSAECEDLNDCAAAGMDDFLSKPLRLADLIGVLNRP